MYTGTLEKQLSEHKTAVKKHNSKNEIRVHSWANQRQVNWDADSQAWGKRLLEERGTRGTTHSTAALNLKPGLWADYQPLMAPISPFCLIQCLHSYPQVLRVVAVPLGKRLSVFHLDLSPPLVEVAINMLGTCLCRRCPAERNSSAGSPSKLQVPQLHQWLYSSATSLGQMHFLAAQSL